MVQGYSAALVRPSYSSTPTRRLLVLRIPGWLSGAVFRRKGTRSWQGLLWAFSAWPSYLVDQGVRGQKPTMIIHLAWERRMITSIDRSPSRLLSN